MAIEQGHQEFDLDRTDRLPVLTGIKLEGADEDSEPMNQPPVAYADDMDSSEATGRLRAVSLEINQSSAIGALGVPGDLVRSGAVDLPSLAESVRTVEERISRQHAEFEAMSRSYERARDAETLALSKAASLERELGMLRSSFEAEQARVRDQEKTLAERQAAALEARNQAEMALRETERFQSEARTLKETLAARDAHISKALHTLGERDAQLGSLKQEHAKAQQSIESRGKTQGRVEEELGKTKARATELEQKLKSAEQGSAALNAKLKRTESEINALRSEIGSTRAVSHAYLESLSSREFRRGFDESLFMELDARVGSVDSQQAQLRGERDKAEAKAANLELKIASQTSAIEKLQSSGSSQAATIAQQAHDLKQAETGKEQLSQKLAGLETERARLAKELAERTAQLKDANAGAAGDVKRLTEQVATSEARLKELTAQIAQLQSEHGDKLARLHAEHGERLAQMQAEHAARFSKLQNDHAEFTSKVQNEYSDVNRRAQGDYAETVARMQKEHSAQLAEIQNRHAQTLAEKGRESEERELEMSVLITHLKEARRPLDPILADVKRLTEELSTKSKAFDELQVEALALRANLERTKGALEEREFLIRRLERAESNNANVLGRIQTSMERLGSAPIVGSPVGEQAEWSAELIRIDGQGEISHSLGRRTRIGRAQGCELQIDSSSVSRHHALIVAGPRESIIEDLGSTNGVILNGRKISRAFLNDGDTVLVGDVQFRFATKKSLKGEREPIEVKSGS